MPGLTYESSGVDYDQLDAFKRACQKAAATTTGALAAFGYREPAAIRGESAYLIETPDAFLAHVEEGLGTKNLVVDEMIRLTGKSLYANVAIDTVATIVNDLITVGALPVSVAMHAAVGDSAWFGRGTVAADLAEGFAEGCRRARAVWGGGETPTLQGIINPETIALAGSAVGMVSPKSNRVAGNVKEGDAIVLLASSGVQTNGLSLCRKIAANLPDGYLTKMDDGRSYGEALLDPSVIYVDFVAGCLREKIPLHYLAHVTGHGWRKLMRLTEPFVYRMSEIGKVPPVFEFIRSAGPVDEREAYATFNMGVGFAAYVEAKEAGNCVKIARSAGYTAWVGGTVHREGNRKAVVIEPLGIVFEEIRSMSGKGSFNPAEELPPISEKDPSRTEAVDFLRTEVVGKATVISLTLPEMLDSDEFDHLNRQLLRTLDSNIRGKWVLNLASVSYMGSSVLGMMVNVRQHVKGGGGTLALAAMSDGLTKIFRTCCLEKLFVITRTVEDAVAKLGG